MHSRTIDVVTEWETVATPDGYEGLRRLADAEFSGAVSAGTTWAFLLNGRVVGVFEGDMEDFAEADVTAYRAADPSLPLLFAMQERGGETQASYYTNETPLKDVDQTLSNGGFTGYVELSENVLSGDYYVVYHGGKSMSAAFVGSSERLLTGEEAFETAADEVGIYEVIDVGVDILEIPAPVAEATDESEADTDDTGGGANMGAAGTAADTPASSDEPDASTPADTPARDPGAPETPADAPESPDVPESDPEPTDAAAGADPRDGGVEGDNAANAAGSDAAEPAGRSGGFGAETTDAADTATTPTSSAESDTDPEGVPREPDSDADTNTDSAGTTETAAATGSDTPSDSSTTGDPAVGVGSGDHAEAPSRASAEDVSDGRSSETETAGTAEPSVETDTEPVDAAASEPTPTETESSTTSDVGSDPTVTTSAAGSGARPDATAESARSAASEVSDGAIADEKRWQDARTIPSLDPEKSTGMQPPDAAETDQSTTREQTARMQRQREQRRSKRDHERTDTGQASSEERRGDPGGTAADTEPDDSAERLRRRLSRARERVESLEAEREELLEERAGLQEERENLVEERDTLRSERAEQADRIEELEAECERLRSEVDRLESELDAGGGGVASAESMSPEQALSGTNLFVRYDTKGQATLKHAHAGEAARDDVRENLRLEHHTTFEADGVAVDEQPYETFLHDSTEYAFAHWVISELLYEIGETGNRSELAGVFDAIPDIDRVEVHGEVGVETNDGVEQRAFDVICRDRMGDPLFVADINPSRNATTEGMVGSLVENTGTVAAEEESLAAGFYVTESFYEPGALETVAEQTGGGILSRSKKRSFVKLSRKRGYHLCLVEARDGEFHLNVPEL